MRPVHGTMTIATACTAVQSCSAPKSILGGVFKARKSNTGNVYIGDITVTTTSGFELTPGDAIPASYALVQTAQDHGSLDLSLIYVNGANTCDKVDFFLVVR